MSELFAGIGEAELKATIGTITKLHINLKVMMEERQENSVASSAD